MTKKTINHNGCEHIIGQGRGPGSIMVPWTLLIFYTLFYFFQFYDQMWNQQLIWSFYWKIIVDVYSLVSQSQFHFKRWHPTLYVCRNKENGWRFTFRKSFSFPINFFQSVFTAKLNLKPNIEINGLKRIVKTCYCYW